MKLSLSRTYIRVRLEQNFTEMTIRSMHNDNRNNNKSKNKLRTYKNYI